VAKKTKRKPVRVCPRCGTSIAFAQPPVLSAFWRCGHCLFHFKRAKVRRAD
jgi:ribosomal protein S27AE